MAQQLSNKKRAAIIVGAVVGVLVIAGVAGSHHQTQAPAAKLAATPNTSAQTPAASSAATPAQAASPATTNAAPAAKPAPSAAATTPAPAVTAAPTPATPAASPPSDDLSNTNTYTNVDGNTVHSPAYSTDGSVPAGATAQCNDGTYSFSQHHSGTCSGHGSVATWL